MLSEFGKELIKEMLIETQKLITSHLKSINSNAKQEYKDLAESSYNRIREISNILIESKDCSL